LGRVTIALSFLMLALAAWRNVVLADAGDGTEEAVAFRQALTLWGWGDSPPTAHPQFFHYPSASIYLYWISQAVGVGVGLATGRYRTAADAGVEFVLDPAYLLSCGRLLGAVGLAVAAWSLHFAVRRVAVGVGIAVALHLLSVPVALRSISQLTPEALAMPCVVMLLLALPRQWGGEGRGTALGGLLAGVLAALKWSLVPVAVTWIVTATMAAGTSTRLRRVSHLWVLGCLGFLMASPFVVLDPSRVSADLSFELRHLAGGHLGGAVSQSLRQHGAQILDALGPVLTLACLARPLLRTAPSPQLLAALSMAVAILIPAIMARAGAPERYIVPAIPLLLFVALDALACIRALLVHPLARLVLVAGVLVPTVPKMLTMFRTPVATPVAQATHALSTTSFASMPIVQDPGATALLSISRFQSLARSRCLQQASPGWHERVVAARGAQLLTVPFQALGSTVAPIEKGGELVELPIFSPSYAACLGYYRALADARPPVLVTSGAVLGRIRVVDPMLDDYWEQASSYWRVQREFRAAGGSFRSEPAIRLLTSPIEADPAHALPPDWWRERALLGSEHANETVSAKELRRVLELVFSRDWAPFLVALSEACLRSGNPTASLRASRLVLVNDPHHVLACRIAIAQLAGSASSLIPDRAGTAPLRRHPGEPGRRWATRVLREWGVDSSLVNAEVERLP
jgi:hypothetical protein